MQLNSKERWGYAILGALLLAIVGVIGFKSSAQRADTTVPQPSSLVKAPHQPAGGSPNIQGEIVVQVLGAVRAPGVYSLPRNSRLLDLLKMAGGLREGADLRSINKAAMLSDGQPIYVPYKGDALSSGFQPSEPRGKLTSGTVSINSASAEELERLPGVGLSAAKKIIAWRTDHGGFSSIDQLREVGGIGEKKLARLQPYLRL